MTVAESIPPAMKSYELSLKNLILPMFTKQKDVEVVETWFWLGGNMVSGLRRYLHSRIDTEDLAVPLDELKLALNSFRLRMRVDPRGFINWDDTYVLKAADTITFVDEELNPVEGVEIRYEEDGVVMVGGRIIAPDGVSLRYAYLTFKFDVAQWKEKVPKEDYERERYCIYYVPKESHEAP